MRLLSASSALSAVFLLLSSGARAAPAQRLFHYGHSCFLLESAGGTRILMDPFGPAFGYPLPVGLRADAITISHEHPDHNHVAVVNGKPRLLRGLTADRKGWIRVTDRVGDVTIRSVGVYHDGRRGADRGLNSIFVFETGGLRIAHLGDLGHELSDDQVSAVGGIDVLLLPVGGGTTLDAAQATRVAERLRPRLVIIPMHHKTAVSNIPGLATVDAFLAGKPEVHRQPNNVLELTGRKFGPSARVVVMGGK